jgi:N-acyl-D-aspartate/D-glutamate deacylase
MAYDLVIKNGRIVDGSGMPGYAGDVGIAGDRIVAVGKVDGRARRTLNADGLIVAPGFIDHHTHMDAQICWDPLATSLCFHGVTSIIMGNCGLTLAPCRPEDRDAAIQNFIRVEGMPRPVLEAGIPWGWETFGEYLGYLEGRIGVNVGCLVGQNAVRQYAMGEAATERAATATEVRDMQRAVRDALRAGALGFSINRRPAHRREDGSPLPSFYADDAEIDAQLAVLARLNVGLIQTNTAGVNPGHMRWFADMSLRSGRPVSWQTLRHKSTDPESHLRLMETAAAEVERGARIFGLSSTSIELGEVPPERNEQTDPAAVADILRSPLALVGTSDAGAHSYGSGQGYGYATRLLGTWVRERRALSIEDAVRSLSFVVATLYDIPDRGLLRPSYKADLVLFDPTTVAPTPSELVQDLPAGEGRNMQRAVGVEATIVSGEPLIERGQPTGALPGQTLLNRLVARTRRRMSVAA